MSKRLGGIIGCKDNTSSWHFINGLPDDDGSNIEAHHYNVGEKPTIIQLYTYINRCFSHSAYWLPNLRNYSSNNGGHSLDYSSLVVC